MSNGDSYEGEFYKNKRGKCKFNFTGGEGVFVKKGEFTHVGRFYENKCEGARTFLNGDVLEG